MPFSGHQEHHGVRMRKCPPHIVTVPLEVDPTHTSCSPFIHIGQGAVSTATFAGVWLRDVLHDAGLTDPIAAQEEDGLHHVRFTALDGMMASVGIEKAMNPYGDVLIAYEMNGEPLPRDHGFPLRIIVPGYAAVRNVKWVERIQVAATEAEGVWQRGLNYKTLPPSVTDASTVQLDQMPSMTEVSLFSGITHIDHCYNDTEDAVADSTVAGASTDEVTSGKPPPPNPGDRIMVRVRGWAYAGGGRNIVRVDVTGDDGTSWATATLRDGSSQRWHRAWAWTFWECTLPVVVQEDGTVHVASKAVDLAFNVQPESSHHTWNVRGLGNNSWYRAHAKVI
jgi:sulfite oxidase